MSDDRRYDEYFAEALSQNAQADDPKTAAAVRDLLAHVESSLNADGHPPEVLESELRLARAAADRILGKAAPDPAPAEVEDLHSAPDASEAAPDVARLLKSLITPRRFLALAAVLYVLSLGFFLRESFVGAPAMDAEGHDVGIELNIAVADFAKEIVTFHVVPAAGPMLKNGVLTKDVEVEIDPGDGPKKHVFKANGLLTPWTLQVYTDSGDVLDYPFDRYEVEIEVAARSDGKALTVQTALEHVPHGLRATLVDKDEASGAAADTIVIRRARTIIFLALLSTLSMLVATIAACSVAWQVVVRGRKVEFPQMVWVAALLFVVPAVRNALPGSPPAGALIDFLVFFWAQVAVMISMASLAYTWVNRPPP